MEFFLSLAGNEFIEPIVLDLVNSIDKNKSVSCV
jgi:hypothetical protein